ncbi:hypothetical protein BC835DRAFT_1527677 [Cytidiella melzeri]|nr:hypothetical protein BC835DRAFT_1527677 [Cytidiella melzeri]
MAREFLALAAELIVYILSYVNHCNLLRCRRLSKKVQAIISDTTSLQYKIELGLTRNIDGRSSHRIISERLEALRHEQRGWERPKPTLVNTLTVPSRDWDSHTWHQHVFFGNHPTDRRRLDVFNFSASFAGEERLHLTTVNTFMQANPNEVLTLLFTKPEGVSLPDVWAPAFVNSGIADLAYVPPTVPMAQSDRDTNRYVIIKTNSGQPSENSSAPERESSVVFLDAGADTERSVPYILPEFEMIWETPFSVTDASFPCSVDRIAGPLATINHMYMINHSLNIKLLHTGVIISDPEDASTTNGVTSILANAAGCKPLSAGRAPNFVLLDFVNFGHGLQAVNTLNGL